jgi:hypothetical protein
MAAVIACGALGLGLLGGTADSAPAAQPRWCANSVSWLQAMRRTGAIVRVKAPVARAVFADRARGRPTYIDLGAPAPSARRLTILILGRDRRNFPLPPHRMFSAGRLMCAHGIVERRHGAPQIRVQFWDAPAGEATF